MVLTGAGAQLEIIGSDTRGPPETTLFTISPFNTAGAGVANICLNKTKQGVNDICMIKRTLTFKRLVGRFIDGLYDYYNC